MTGRTQLDYWCHTDLSLKSLFARFTTGFITRDVEIDIENVWCWAEGTMEDGHTCFNISRKHYIGVEPEVTRLPVEPVSIRFTRVHPTVKELELGQKLADVLQLEVFFGNRHYVGGDEFLFLAQHSFQPFANHPLT